MTPGMATVRMETPTMPMMRKRAMFLRSSWSVTDFEMMVVKYSVSVCSD